MSDKLELLRRLLVKPCRTRGELVSWTRLFTGLRLPPHAVCAHHQSPLEYLWRAYREPCGDLVVWAPRGGGKTRLAAVATLLDLLHKPGCNVRILGGSLDQSLKMWEHLLPDLEMWATHLLEQRRAARKIRLLNGSVVAVLTQSERAVRGLRVQKLRCDEVEMFEPRIWEAAQLVTRSLPSAAGKIHGAIEAISTHHKVGGMMGRIIDRAAETGTPVIHWCLLDVLEKCPAGRDCGSCALWEECGGIAKIKCNGFMKIDDAIAMKQRVSRETWESEMLCTRPAVTGCVFPSFSVETHVKEQVEMSAGCALSLAIDFGFNSPFVCLWIRDDGQRCFVVDEYLQTQSTVAQNMEQVESRSWGRAQRICCDPAGAGRNDQTARSNIQLLRDRGYKVYRRHSLIQDGLELLRADLNPAIGPARLFIHPRCQRLIAALKQYRYPDGGGEVPVKDGEHDHPIDALRYYYVNRKASGATTRSY